jgi:uncharacterized protein involved in exopolysaccharide biosynthesis
MTEISSFPSTNDEIDISTIWNSLWQQKSVILTVTTIFTILSLLYALTREDIFRAEAVLAPAELRQSNSPLSAQLGGAASLIGISVDGQESGRTSNSLAILQSRAFIQRFILEHGLLVPLFAGTWSELSGYKVDPKIYNSETNEWIREGGAPSDQQAYRLLRQALTISQDSNTGIIRIGIEWHDPNLAALWVNKLVDDINRDIRNADVDEARSAIEFLRTQLDSTQLVEMQRVFYQLIEAQTRVIMLADARSEYVFQIIDPAVMPEQTIGPRVLQILLVGGLSGLMFSLLVVYFLSMSRKSGNLKN